jgi:predicted O-methyltransferase YrrM
VQRYWKLLKSVFAQSGRSHEQSIVPIVPSIDAPSLPALPAVGATDSGTIDGARSADAEGASPGMTTEADARIRPLGPRMGNALEGMPVTAASMTAAMNSATGDELCAYFHHYPPGSLMGGKSRALLFALTRMLRPRAAAEIGTYFAGGAEVIARALWENGDGTLHTADPFGADRCPAILAAWPAELRSLVKFYPLNSMEFLIKLHHQGLALDFVLVDGDHDYEPALFDLQMTARLLRPGGVVVMNDSVQSGPFQAARTFLAGNPAWRELGTAIRSYDEKSPFAGERVSQPDTGFVILQAPDHWSVSATPRSWGQAATGLPFADGLSFDAPPQVTTGTLHYQAILRMFGDGAPREAKSIGSIPMRLQGTATTFLHKLEKALTLGAPTSVENIRCTFEIELCWHADRGCPPLALASIPVACTTAT